MSVRSLVGLATGLSLFFSCDPVNAPPRAELSASALEARVGTRISLDGSKSADPEKGAISFHWTVKSPQGSAAILAGVDGAQPTLTLDKTGEYAVSLVVIDAAGASSSATVTVNAVPATANSAPTAKPVAATQVTVGDTLVLDGSGSTDADGDLIEFEWTLLSVPEKSEAQLEQLSLPKSGLTPDLPGAYSVQLVVKDRLGARSAPAFLTFDAVDRDLRPVAVARSSAPELPAGKEVTLDATQSKDSEGKISGFRWSLKSAPAGSSALLTEAQAQAPRFSIQTDLKGSYVFELVVLDEAGQESAAETVTVHARGPGETAPVAAIEVPEQVMLGATTLLDGSSSADADQADLELKFAWRFSSKPSKSQATLTGTDAVKASFKPDALGHYVVGLKVTDPHGNESAERLVDVVVVPANAAPTAVARALTAQVEVGGIARLDASASRDAENGVLRYHWSFVSVPAGSAARLSSPQAPRPGFIADVEGDYVLALLITDDVHVVKAEHVTVTAVKANAAPTAELSLKQLQNGEIQLDGSESTDPEGQELSFALRNVWAPQGSKLARWKASAGVAKVKPDLKGFYKFELVVSDGGKKSKPVFVSYEIDGNDQAPVADLQGPDASELGEIVTLSAAGSVDVEGRPLTYAWRLQSAPRGSTAQLSLTTTPVTQFKADKRGQYVFALVVTDAAGQASVEVRKTMSVELPNAVPQAVLKTKSPTVAVGQPVELDASESMDPETADLGINYVFRLLTKPDGSQAALVDGEAPSLKSFTPDKLGFYAVGMVVTDGVKQSDVQYLVIEATAEDLAPVVAPLAAADTFAVGSVARFAANAEDPENAPLTHAWTLLFQPAGSFAVIEGETTAAPSMRLDQLGLYILQVEVSDGTSTTTDYLVLQAVPADALPLAAAHAAPTAAAGSLVRLDGTESFDPENTELTYLWTLVSKPEGSAAVLSDPQSAAPSFEADLAGAYTFELVVTDGAGQESAPAKVTVTAQ
jgi:hypothetical protein